MKKKARPIAVIDAETDPFEHGKVPMPFLWGFYDGERFLSFPDVKALLRYLEGKEFVIYAHNGGKFDYHYLIDWIEPYSDVMVINGRLSKFYIGQNEFRDSYNIFPMGLSKYKKDKINYDWFKKAVRKKHMVAITEYLKNDCKYLYELVSGFQETYGKGLTLAGAAMSFWSNLTGIERPQSDSEFYDSIKPYYYGGRVECFFKGTITKRFHMVDINSAYPYAMIHEHPFSTKISECRPSLKDAIVCQSFYTVVAESRGAFPWRDKDGDGSLSFPNDGKPREFHITGWEMRAAKRTKTAKILEIVKRVDFLKEINFADYVDHFYKLKKNSEKGSKDYLFAKLMQNSLYGKFACDPREYASYGVVPRNGIDGAEADPELKLGRHSGPWKWIGYLGRLALMVGKDDEGNLNPAGSQFYNVATGASITGFVRAFLWEAICKIRKAGGLPHYCDTDSIAFQFPGEEKDIPLPFSNELGDWSHEGQFTRGYIAGKKLYSFHKAPECREAGKSEWKTASKGVKLSAEEIAKVAQGEVVTYRNPVPSFSVAARLRSGGKLQDATFIVRDVKRT